MHRPYEGDIKPGGGGGCIKPQWPLDYIGLDEGGKIEGWNGIERDNGI